MKPARPCQMEIHLFAFRLHPSIQGFGIVRIRLADSTPQKPANTAWRTSRSEIVIRSIPARFLNRRPDGAFQNIWCAPRSRRDVMSPFPAVWAGFAAAARYPSTDDSRAPTPIFN